MGCVTFTDRYLLNCDGVLTITPKSMAKATLAAAEELEQIKANYLRESWDICFGSSGTIKTIAELMPAQTPTGLITVEGIQWLYDEITGGKYKEFGQIPKARRLVLPAGVAILKSIFTQMKIKHLHVSNAALKEGLIFETAGRNKRYDIRDETIAQQIEKYLIDENQVHRVRGSALELFCQLEIPAPKAINPTKLLGWSAGLHEIGLTLSHSGYHHHSRYMVENMDLAGFNRYDQHLLALIVGAHRRKINPENLAVLAQEHRPVILAMVICLRLACLLSRKREDPITVPQIEINDDTVRLRFDDQWLDSNPLSKQSLTKEAEYLSRINLSLEMA
jgi:exopolyphosphatase/guanosine-5'-triphosphate,3'-diphosphate pyrophosphatase